MGGIFSSLKRNIKPCKECLFLKARKMFIFKKILQNFGKSTWFLHLSNIYFVSLKQNMLPIEHKPKIKIPHTICVQQTCLLSHREFNAVVALPLYVYASVNVNLKEF